MELKEVASIKEIRVSERSAKDGLSEARIVFYAKALPGTTIQASQLRDLFISQLTHDPRQYVAHIIGAWQALPLA